MSSALFRPPSQWPVIAEVDVLVIGAGPGGLGAAVAAGRLGLKTLVVERYGFPGGVATVASCPYLMGFAHGDRQIAGGVADDLVRELDAMGEATFVTPANSMPEGRPIGDRPLLNNVITSVEGVRIAGNRLLKAAGVTCLYYTSLIGAVVEDGRVTAAAVDCVEGPGLIRAACFVDASGDAHLVYRAGGKVVAGRPEDTMTKTILIRAGGVPEFDRPAVTERFKKLVEEGRIPLKGQDRLMGLGLPNPGEVELNFTLTGGDALLSSELTRMDMEMREQILVALDFFRKEIPGFADCYLVDAGAAVGVRAGRNIVGLETITQTDIDEDTPVDEPIAVGTRGYGGHGLEGFAPSWGKWHAGTRGIPLKALIPVGFRNVMVAGRAISCEVRVISTFRLMSRCMAIGQAAGVTAGLAVRDGCNVPEVSYGAVRDELLAGKAILS